MRRAAVVAAIVLGLSGSAAAAPWMAPLGDEVGRATTIEVARVEKVHGLDIEARVTQAIRSTRRVGDAVTWSRELLSMAAPAVGDEIVGICDAQMCPRIIGVRQGRVFRLNAGSPDQAWVAWIAPEVVTIEGLRAMAAGRTPPRACVRGTVQLLDERAPVPVDLRVDGASGRGRGRIGDIDVAIDWTTRPTIENFGDGVFVRVGTDERGAMMYTDRARIEGGCVVGDFWWGGPSAAPRTMDGVASVMAGTFGPRMVAVGALTIDAGGPVAAGRYEARVERGLDGELTLTSTLASGPLTAEHSRSEISRGRPSLGVDLGAPAKGALVVLFDQHVIDHVHHTSLMFVEDLATRHRVTLPLLWVPLPLPASGPPAFVEIGRATLDYVREDGAIDAGPPAIDVAPARPRQSIAR